MHKHVQESSSYRWSILGFRKPGGEHHISTCWKAAVKVGVAWTAGKMEVGMTFPCISMCRKAVVIDGVSWASGNQEGNITFPHVGKQQLRLEWLGLQEKWR